MPLRAVPFIVRQLSPTECGLACLSMVCAAWGQFFPLRDLRLDIPPGRDGVSGSVLWEWLEGHGFNCQRAREISTNDGDGNYLYLALLDNSHFVIIDAISTSSVRIADPALGRQTITPDKFIDRFSGYALRVSPGTRQLAMARPLNRLLPIKEIVVNLRQMIQIIGTSLYVLYALAFIVSLIPLLSSVLIAYIVNSISLSPVSSHEVWTAIGAFFTGSIVVILLRNLLSVSVNIAAGQKLSSNFIETTISSPFSTLRNYPGGDLVARLGSISAIRGFLVHTIAQSTLDFLSMFVYSTALLLIYPSIGLVALVGVGFVGITGAMVGLKQYSSSFSLAKSQADMNSNVFELLKNIEYVKMASREYLVIERWRKIMANYYEEERRIGRRQAFVDVVVSLAAIGFPVIALGFSVPLVSSGQMSIGLMVGVNTLLGSLFASSRSLLSASDNFYSVSVAISRYVDLVDLRSAIQKNKNSTSLSNPKFVRDDSPIIHGASGALTSICLDDVYFRYPGAPSLLLTGISCVIDAGTMVGIVGATGSGKSTLLRIISGIEQPTSGSIRVVRESHRESLTSSNSGLGFGVVTQSIALFSGTIRTNIMAGIGRVEDGDDAELWNVLDAACLGDEIRAMPMMLDTQLGEGGAGLSGGQKQRLCVARALLGASEVLIIDEGLSGCDMNTEAAVLSNLRARGATVILVTHRHYVSDMCDRVYRLSGGVLI